MNKYADQLFDWKLLGMQLFYVNGYTFEEIWNSNLAQVFQHCVEKKYILTLYQPIILQKHCISWYDDAHSTTL